MELVSHAQQAHMEPLSHIYKSVRSGVHKKIQIRTGITVAQAIHPNWNPVI